MFPVGLIGQRQLSTPVVRKGMVTGFYGWKGGRKFPVDTAGFAINVGMLLKVKKNVQYFKIKVIESGLDVTYK